MVKFEILQALEKSSNIDLRYCEIIAVNTVDDESGCTTKRVVKADERYYMHIMHNGNVVQCFEVVLSWQPWENVLVFAFTPDNIHEYQIDVRGDKNSRPDEKRICNYDIQQIAFSRIKHGMKCSYNNCTIELINDEHISINGKIITVEKDYNYAYKLMKSKIKAVDGAKGLFAFLDEIAENGKIEKFPSLYFVFDKIAEKYA